MRTVAKHPPAFVAAIVAERGHRTAAETGVMFGLSKNAVIGIWHRERTTQVAPRESLFAVLSDLSGAARATQSASPRQCCWPIGNPSDADFRFCTAPATAPYRRDAERPTYCAGHHALAYAPQGARHTGWRSEGAKVAA